MEEVEEVEELSDLVLDLEIPVDTRPMIQLSMIVSELLWGEAAQRFTIWGANMRGVSTAKY